MGSYQLRMGKDLREIALSWIFVLLVGWILWPPRAVYWQSLAKYVGDPLTLLTVGILALGSGFAFVHLTTVQARPLVAGAGLAYLSGMVVIETVLAPDSPVHLILYGGLLLCLVSGGFLRRYLR